eukprot:1141323-Pelagomonas_calceolata.AAC.1
MALLGNAFANFAHLLHILATKGLAIGECMCFVYPTLGTQHTTEKPTNHLAYRSKLSAVQQNVYQVNPQCIHSSIQSGPQRSNSHALTCGRLCMPWCPRHCAASRDLVCHGAHVTVQPAIL